MPKRRQPWNPCPPAHDRTSNVVPFRARTATRVVDDPYGPGQIAVTVSLRDDALGVLYADGKISQPQWAAGGQLRECLNRTEFGRLKSVNLSREPVDGGGAYVDSGAERRRKAYDEVARVRSELGPQAFALVRSVVSQGQFLTHPADIARLCDALDQLAVLFGLQGRPRGAERPSDKYSAMAAKRAA